MQVSLCLLMRMSQRLPQHILSSAHFTFGDATPLRLDHLPINERADCRCTAAALHQNSSIWLRPPGGCRAELGRAKARGPSTTLYAHALEDSGVPLGVDLHAGNMLRTQHEVHALCY